MLPDFTNGNEMTNNKNAKARWRTHQNQNKKKKQTKKKKRKKNELIFLPKPEQTFFKWHEPWIYMYHSNNDLHFGTETKWDFLQRLIDTTAAAIAFVYIDHNFIYFGHLRALFLPFYPFSFPLHHSPPPACPYVCWHFIDTLKRTISFGTQWKSQFQFANRHSAASIFVPSLEFDQEREYFTGTISTTIHSPFLNNE